MGNKFRTAQNLLVFRVVPELNMLAVVGHVPGPENGIVELWDSNKKWKEPVAPPPFPAYVRQPTDVIKHYSEFEDGTEFIDLKGEFLVNFFLSCFCFHSFSFLSNNRTDAPSLAPAGGKGGRLAHSVA